MLEMMAVLLYRPLAQFLLTSLIAQRVAHIASSFLTVNKCMQMEAGAQQYYFVVWLTMFLNV